ncbi:MAG: hypothetical protein ACR2GY_02145 [Phycisphaerales bacterium]
MAHFLNIRSSLLIAAIAVIAGCNKTTSQRREMIPPGDTRLYFDPTDQYTLAEWWSNGSQMLHLRDDYSYAIFDEPNRYREPVERGQWSQKHYAALELEPYLRRSATVRRVIIDKDSAGNIVLIIGDLKPLAAVDQPPVVLEDMLLGTWESETTRITIRRNGRYSYRRTQPVPVGEVARSSHEGTWHLDQGDALLLTSDSALEPIKIEARVIENEMRLSGFERIEE